VSLRPRLAPLVALAAALGAGTCVVPTEHDSLVHVSMSRILVLFRGNDTVATARAWQMVGSADSVPISNVVFVWSSSDPAVATVDNSGRIVGIKSGTVIITAAVRNFDKRALAAADTLRVSASIEVDSIRPKTVKYGEFLTIYGIGVDSIFSATLSSAQLIPNLYADTVYANGTARRQYWVPPPAHTDSVFFFGIFNGSGQFGFVRGETTKVEQRDLYEPDDTIPQPIDLDAPPPFAVVPQLLVFNPALAFERLQRGEVAGADWYHFTQTGTRDLTIILTAQQIAGTFRTFVTDSLGWDLTNRKYIIGQDSWTFGPGTHACHGVDFPFKVPEKVADSTIVAFKALPLSALDAIAVYTVAGRYGLGVIAGYQSELPADKHEDDNSCNAADLRGTVQVSASGYRDTLTIENPHDVDWIRFHYTQGPLLSTAQVRLHALPGTHPDSLKDLDLYVVKVPVSGDATIQVLAADTSAGSDADLRPGLATGDYYLAVVDFAGTTTTYELCVATITVLGAGPCAGTVFPSPPLRASAGPRPGRTAAVSAGSRFVPSRRQ